MSGFVVDAGAAVEALGGKGAPAERLRRKLIDAECHAPHLIDAEVGQVLSRSVRRGEMKELTAATALRGLIQLIDHRYPHAGGLAEQAWRLRHTISFYDALYVALAARLDVPLLTTDVRLTKAGDLCCRVELIS
ncbi:MAG TPA: type II toxin-antitoxin system VapC family toxin [Pseudonocardiaceae bacterium]